MTAINTKLGGQVIKEPPSEYLVEIGRVMVRWNVLEGYLDFTLIKFLGKSINEVRSHAVFTHMAVPQKLDVLAALVNEIVESHPETSAPLAAVYKHAAPLLKEAQRRRNDIAHAKWGVDDDGTITANKVSARGKVKLEQRTMPIDDVIAASNAIYTAMEALYEMAWNPNRPKII
jgi:hypothetical protein